MAEVTLTSENFEQEVLKSPVPVLVDFWAEWCGPCRVIGPTIAQLAEKYEGKFKIGKVNVDEQGELAQKYQILSIPNLKFFKDGAEVDQIVGAAPAATIEATISKYIAPTTTTV
ncbi:MAG: thioredoxin [Candidatus Doudnabacteria bacterium]|nr:thioredoxin [Candidatus Doudnabacteria bacterium]